VSKRYVFNLNQKCVFRAEREYESALEGDPDLEDAKLRLSAIRCWIRKEEALGKRRARLRRALIELKRQRERQEEWASLLAKMRDNQASEESRLASRLAFERSKIRASPRGLGVDCVESELMGQKVLSCDLGEEEESHLQRLARPKVVENKIINVSEEVLDRFDPKCAFNKTQTSCQDFGLQIPQVDDVMRTFEARVRAMSGNTLDFNITGDPPDLRVDEFFNREDSSEARPSLPAKYAVWPSEQAEKPAHSRSGWPSRETCDAARNGRPPPKWNEFPTVFLSPENKGFE